MTSFSLSLKLLCQNALSHFTQFPFLQTHTALDLSGLIQEMSYEERLKLSTLIRVYARVQGGKKNIIIIIRYIDTL